LQQERRLKSVELRKQRMDLREIAAIVGCSHETVRSDINHYMAQLDAACIQGAAAMRAEMGAVYDELISRLSVEVLENNNYERTPELIKATEGLRKLYALDIQPMNRTELRLRRAVITEITTKLRDQLTPEAFALVASCLVADEPIQLLEGVALPTEDGDAEAVEPPRSRAPRSGRQAGPGAAGGQQLDAGLQGPADVVEPTDGGQASGVGGDGAAPGAL
jgi:hypothetical protein